RRCRGGSFASASARRLRAERTSAAMSMRSYRRRASNCVGLDHENQAQGMFLFAVDWRQPARGGSGVTARMAAVVALAAAGTMVQAQSETELRVYAAGSL